MAAPAIPQNFWVQTGNQQNYLSWNIVAGATSYSVQRSTDGVSYTVVSSPTSTEYLDTSPTLGTQYWYRVASVNADGTSGYTNAQTTVASKQGEMTLGDIRLRAQQRADRVNSQFVQLPEWNFFINQAYYELYDLLITAYEDYFVAPPLQFTTNNGQFYDLPDGVNYSGAPAFYKLSGVDCALNNSTNAYVTLKRFNFIARNRYVYPQITNSILGVFNMQYDLVGNQLMLIPTPNGVQGIRLWYFPRLTTLLKDEDSMDGISGWTQYVIIRAAKYALDKEESDTTKLDAELLFLKGRIEETAVNRDAGQANTISDVRSRAEKWGGGPNGDGSFGGW